MNEILAVENKINSWPKGPMVSSDSSNVGKIITSNETVVPKEVSMFEVSHRYACLYIKLL